MTTRTWTAPALAGHAKTRGSLPFWGWLEIYRQRRALSRLDAAALADIGVSQSAAETEANRPIWDVPTHWQD